MAKIAFRLLMLSMFTTALLVAPVVAEVSAATSSKHVKKKKVRVTHQSPKVANPYASPVGNRYEDDPDRKAAGGGY